MVRVVVSRGQVTLDAGAYLQIPVDPASRRREQYAPRSLLVGWLDAGSPGRRTELLRSAAKCVEAPRMTLWWNPSAEILAGSSSVPAARETAALPLMHLYRGRDRRRSGDLALFSCTQGVQAVSSSTGESAKVLVCVQQFGRIEEGDDLMT